MNKYVPVPVLARQKRFKRPDGATVMYAAPDKINQVARDRDIVICLLDKDMFNLNKYGDRNFVDFEVEEFQIRAKDVQSAMVAVSVIEFTMKHSKLPDTIRQ